MMTRQTKKSMPARGSPGQTSPAPRVCVRGTGEKSTTGGRNVRDSKHIRSKDKLVFGTWNVETLWKDGRLEELCHELDHYKWNVIGLSEVRMKALGEINSSNGNKLFYCGRNDIHVHGVGFLVHKDTAKHVLGCDFISSRMISLRLNASPFNITIFQVYAPTTDYNDEEIETFYQDIQQNLDKAPKKDIKIILGDFNARVGKDSFKDWPKQQGPYCNDKTNDRGLRLLEFANYNDLVIANTLGNHKKQQIMTWHHPNGANHGQIDYILVQTRFKSSVYTGRTRTFPRPDIGSPHDLVMMTFKLKLRKMAKPQYTRLKFDLDKLQDPLIAEEFKAAIGGKFGPLLIYDESSELETNVETFEKATIETATDILGKRITKKKAWVSNDILKLCDKRRELKAKKKNCSVAKSEYSKVNKQVKKEMVKAKEKWIEDQCEDIENNLSKNNSKKAYDTVKNLTKPKQSKVSTIKDKNGETLIEKNRILQRWTEYCSELYNHELNGDESVLDVPNSQSDDSENEIQKAEIEEAIKKLKKGKSPGVDNIPGELIQAGGDFMTTALLHICNKIFIKKTWPENWTKSLVITLPKKGDLKLCNNYRTLSLISHPSKVLLRVILNRLKHQASEIISEEQAGFMSGRSTAEQIFNLRMIIEKYQEHQQELYHVFIDFKKAFDRVWHQALWATMHKFNIDQNLIALIQELYNHATSSVYLDGDIGEWFRTTVGVRQGCLLSPTLFNIFLERIMTDALDDHEPTVSIGGRTVSNLRFADDIDGLAGSENELSELIRRLNDSCTSYGMEISAEKTKIMTNSQANGLTNDITINGSVLQCVDQFIYLGAIVSDTGSKSEILSRIAKAQSSLSKLKVVWNDKSISLQSKIRLLRTIVISVFLYACESWTLDAYLEQRIAAFEMRCLRRLLGIDYRDHITNVSVREKVTAEIGRHQELLEIVKARKLKWFGHTTRKNCLAKECLQGTVRGGRGRGRPRKKWADNVKEWTGLSFAEATRAAERRDDWRGIVRMASSSSGPLQRRMAFREP